MLPVSSVPADSCQTDTATAAELPLEGLIATPVEVSGLLRGVKMATTKSRLVSKGKQAVVLNL